MCRLHERDVAGGTNTGEEERAAYPTLIGSQDGHHGGRPPGQSPGK